MNKYSIYGDVLGILKNRLPATGIGKIIESAVLKGKPSVAAGNLVKTIKGREIPPFIRRSAGRNVNRQKDYLTRYYEMLDKKAPAASQGPFPFPKSFQEEISKGPLVDWKAIRNEIGVNDPSGLRILQNTRLKDVAPRVAKGVDYALSGFRDEGMSLVPGATNPFAQTYAGKAAAAFTGIPGVWPIVVAGKVVGFAAVHGGKIVRISKDSMRNILKNRSKSVGGLQRISTSVRKISD